MGNVFNKSLAVIVGGGIGSYLRYQVQGWVQTKAGSSLPYGTWVVNVTGSFLIGLLMTVFLEHLDISPQWRLFLVVGGLGGYTTFSSLSWEAYQLFALGSYGQGALYVLGSALGGAMAVILGVFVGRMI